MTFLACQHSDAKENIDIFSFEKSSWSKKFATETLIQELNHVFDDKNEFQHSTKSTRKLIYLGTFLRKSFKNIHKLNFLGP